MRSFLGAMRRQPLDHTGDAPTVPPRLAGLVVVAVIAMTGLFAWSQWQALTHGEANVRRELVARGLGSAEIVRSGWCKAGGPRYRWRTAAREGLACAGVTGVRLYAVKVIP